MKWRDNEVFSCIVYCGSLITRCSYFMPKLRIWLGQACKVCNLMNEGLKQALEVSINEMIFLYKVLSHVYAHT